MTDVARPGLPTVDQVLMLPAGDRRAAPPEWEDANGHVNVSAYYDFHMRATEGAVAELGWNEKYIERTGKSLFSLEHHLQFYDETLVGQEVSVHVRLLDRNERLLHGVSILVNHTTGCVANTVEFVEAHVDLATRRTSLFLLEFTEVLDRMLEEHRRLPWSVPLNGAMGLRLAGASGA